VSTKNKVLLGVTGGIAAYKAADIVRLLIKNDLEVHVVMTHNAQKFITPLTLQTLSQRPVWTDLFHLTNEQQIGHICLVEQSDVVLVAPATANILAKTAHGIADDLLSTILCVASKSPVIFAPAMNIHMYLSPITQENIKKLKSLGYHFVEPAEGELACGSQGVGRLADTEEIVERVLFELSPKDLGGETVLVTAGRTEEEIDPVRFLTNPSSGKMGVALARAASQRGARVILVSGPTCCRVPLGVRHIPVRSAEHMYNAVKEVYPETTIVLMAAAVSDFRPCRRERQKIKKDKSIPSLALEKTPDILRELGMAKGERFIVGFAAESEELIRNAEEKLKKKNLDIIVANDIAQEGIGFQSDMNQATLVQRDGTIESLPLLTKDSLAHRIIDRVCLLRRSKQPTA
jgi:phosphopantothenoylcysteine decarboxylase/phosphopantothenate--cysteine ligase